MAESPRPLWLARDELLATLLDVSSRAPPAAAAEIGALRLEVRVDGVSDPIHWLAHTPPVLPRVYFRDCLLYTSPSPRDKRQSRMPSSA